MDESQVLEFVKSLKKNLSDVDQVNLSICGEEKEKFAGFQKLQFDDNEEEEDNKMATATEMFELAFQQCDEYNAGSVRASKMIQLIGKLSNFDDFKRLERLRNLLDPSRDDCFVDKPTFLECCDKWMNEMLNENNDNKEIDAENDSSFGLLKNDVLNHTFRLDHTACSLAESDSDNEVSEIKVSKIDVSEYTREKEEMEKFIRKLSEDNGRLLDMYTCSDDQYQNLQNEMKEMKSKMKMSLINMEESLKSPVELAQLRETISAMEEKTYQLQKQSEIDENKIKELMEENTKLLFELSSNSDLLNGLKETEKQLKVDLDTLCKDFYKMQVDMELKNVEIENLTNFLHKLEREKEKIEEDASTLQNKLDNLACEISLSINHEKTKSMVLSVDVDSDGSYIGGNLNHSHFDDEDFILQSVKNGKAVFRTPRALSTPILKHRGTKSSLGEELKEANNNNNSHHTPVSPLVEKSLNVNKSANSFQKISFRKDLEGNPEVVDDPTLFALKLLCLVFLGLFFFTYFGAVVLKDKTLVPYTWIPNRMFKPFISFRFSTFFSKKFIW